MATTTFTIDHAVRLFKALPRVHNRVQWSADIGTTAYIASTIVTAADQTAAVKALVKAGATLSTLYNISRGCRTDGLVWPVLREAMTTLGVQWRLDRADLRAAQRRAAEKGQAAAKGAAQVSTKIRRPEADVVAPAKVEVRPEAAAPVAVAPIANPPTSRPAATLAVTQAGAVEVTTAPARATAPSAMVARHVAPVVKDPPRNWRLDPETQDILVTTVTRYTYGTPEHRRKLLELATAGALGNTASK